MTLRPDVHEELATWAALQLDLEEALSNGAEQATRVAADISAWSALHHIAHVTLANELVLRNLKNLAKGSGMLVVVDAEQNPEALAILAGGHMPRGRAQAPRMVVPPKDLDFAQTTQWVAQFKLDLAAFTAELDAVNAPRCFIPHQVLGPLDLAQWVRFGAMHTRHHLTIAREVLATQ